MSNSIEVYVDTETTTKNKGHPFNPDNKLVSYAISYHDNDTCFRYFTDPDFRSRILEISSAGCYTGFNCKFDLHWLGNEGIHLPLDCKVWDCMIAEYVISGQQSVFPSLNETLAQYGLELKDDLVANYWSAGVDTIAIPVSVLEEYNSYDSDCLVKIKEFQIGCMSPAQIKLVYLMGEDLKVIVHAERAGIKFDRTRALSEAARIGQDVEATSKDICENYCKSDPSFVLNLDSGDHLSALLYGGTVDYEYSIPTAAIYKSGDKKGESYTKNNWHKVSHTFPRIFRPLEGTEVKKTIGLPESDTHFYQTDEPTLKQLGCRTNSQKELLSALSKRSKAIKVKEMIETILNKFTEFNWQDNLIHAQFNQTVARTGRLSSSGPNMQNTPVEVDELLVSRYAD